MYEHHEKSLQNLITYFKGKEGVIALIFEGSVAKGTERVDSDIDATVILTEEQYKKHKQEGRLAETIKGYCTYEGGYFDIKYKSKAFLKLAAEFGNEPTKAAYDKAKVLFSDDLEIEPLLTKVSTFPKKEKEHKCKVFYANLWLNQNYYMYCVPKENRYMMLHIVSEVVYCVYRLILEENEILFPCNRRLEEYVEKCENKPSDIMSLSKNYMDKMDNESCNAFVNAYLAWTKLDIPKNVNDIISIYCDVYEDWWLNNNSPFVNEW